MVYYITVAHADIAQQVERILGKDEVPGPNPGISSRKTSQKWLVFCYKNTCLGPFEVLWSGSEGPRFYFSPVLPHILPHHGIKNMPQSLDL